MNININWQIYLLGYLVGMAVFSYHYKNAVKDSQNDCASTVLLQLIGAVSILALSGFYQFKLPAEPTPYLLLIVVSVFYALNNRLQTSARKNLDISTFSVFNQFTFIFLAIGGLIYLKDSLTVGRVLAIFLMLGANLLILLKKDSLVLNKYVLSVILSSLAAAIGTLIGIGLSQNFNLPFYISLTFVIPALMLAISQKIKPEQIKEVFSGPGKSSYLSAGIVWGLTILCSINAMQSGQASLVAPLQAANVFINVLTGHLYMRESGNIFPKLASGLLVIGAVFVNLNV